MFESQAQPSVSDMGVGECVITVDTPAIVSSKFDTLVVITQQHGVARNIILSSSSRAMAAVQANVRLACEDEVFQRRTKRLVWYEQDYDGIARGSRGRSSWTTQL